MNKGWHKHRTLWDNVRKRTLHYVSFPRDFFFIKPQTRQRLLQINTDRDSKRKIFLFGFESPTISCNFSDDAMEPRRGKHIRVQRVVAVFGTVRPHRQNFYNKCESQDEKLKIV